MAINKVEYGGSTLIDLTNTTATAATIFEGYGAYGRDGVWIDGTASTGQTIRCGTSTPSSSLGEDGDIYIQTNAGGSSEFYPTDYTYDDLNSSSNAGNCINVSAEDGSSTSNVYSSGSNTTGYIDYSFGISNIPSNAEISSVSCEVKAHEENKSRSSFTLQLYSGSTAKGSATTVDGTSNTTYTLDVGSWTRSELDSLTLHTEYGYYGGLVAGATLTINYILDTPSYEITLNGSANSWSISGSQIYEKSNGTWSQVSSITLEDTIKRG